MITVSTRLDEKIVKEIEKIALEMNLEKGVLIRKYILDGYKQTIMKRNIKLVKAGELTIGQAANNSGVSIYNLLEFARGLDIHFGADSSTLSYEMEVLKKIRVKK